MAQKLIYLHPVSLNYKPFSTYHHSWWSGAEIDLFTPSFPELQTIFNLSPFMVELLLSINLIAHCISSLIVGNLGDRYGRKNIIILGLIIFIIGSLLCVFALNYWYLLLGRVLQGIGIAGPSVLDFLVITDNYPPEQQQHKIGLLNGFATLSVALAPVIGSYISLFFKWQGNFVTLLLLGIFCLILAIKFLPQSKINHAVKFYIKEYLTFFNSKIVIYSIITICFITQSYWIFVGMAPILYMEAFDVSLKHFGFYQGSLCLLFAIVSLSSGYLIKKFGTKNCLIFGLVLLIMFTIATFILMVLKINNPIIITLVLQLEAIGVVFPINILWPISINAVPGGKARVTAVLTTSRLILTSIGLQLVSFIYKEVFFHIGLVMALSLIVGLIACYRLLKIIPWIATPKILGITATQNLEC